MNKDEALNIAIEALDTLMMEKDSIYQQAIQACKEALEQPVTSADPYLVDNPNHHRIGKKVLFAASKAPSPHVIFGLERSPRGESRSILGNTMKDWVGLSDDEIMNIARESYMSRDGGDIKFARAIEATLKENNYA